jgi:hypothetical protein
MIAHVVLFRPKPELSRRDRRLFVESFEHALREIPTVRGVRLGRRVKHGAGYERQSPDVVDFVAIIDFDDLAGLQAYLRHPAHAELGTRFGESLSSALVYDFEEGRLEDLVD